MLFQRKGSLTQYFWNGQVKTAFVMPRLMHLTSQLIRILVTSGLGV